MIPSILEQIQKARALTTREQSELSRKSEKLAAIEQAVRAHGNCTVAVLERFTGLSSPTLREALAELEKTGRLYSWKVGNNARMWGVK